MEPSKLWKKSKILFIVALPLIALILFKDILLALLVSGGTKEVKKTKKKDEELKDKVEVLEKEAAKSEGKIERIKEEIKEIDSSKDENWHLEWNLDEDNKE